MFNLQETPIWKKYKKSSDFLNSSGYIRQSVEAQRFYEGDQWHYLKTGGFDIEKLSQNIIKPTVKFKVAMVALNQMQIVYSPFGLSKTESSVCEVFNDKISRFWEKNKLDTLCWDIVKGACVVGEKFLYLYNDPKNGICACPLDNTSVFYADEEQGDLNSQKYIIISQCELVENVKKQALLNKIPKAEIEKIIPDNEKSGKCTTLLFLQKTPEGIRFSKSTRHVIFKKDALIKGLMHYPIISMMWEKTPFSPRGLGAVKPIIPLQIAINQTLMRRHISIKRNAFPTKVVDMERVENPKDLDFPGSTLKVKNLGDNPISTLVSYLSPAPMSSDAAVFQNELMEITRNLEGAGNSVTGQINPEKATGASIRAARDQSAIPLNEQTVFFKQFIEDLALLFYQMTAIYLKNGFTVELDGKTQFITKQKLLEIEPIVKIDVTPSDPFSLISQELSLEKLLDRGLITFQEYVDALDRSSSVPKAKLTAILEKRKKEEKENGNKKCDNNRNSRNNL